MFFYISLDVTDQALYLINTWNNICYLINVIKFAAFNIGDKDGMICRENWIALLTLCASSVILMDPSTLGAITELDTHGAGSLIWWSSMMSCLIISFITLDASFQIVEDGSWWSCYWLDLCIDKKLDTVIFELTNYFKIVSILC